MEMRILAYGKRLLAGCAGGVLLSGSSFAQDAPKLDDGRKPEEGRKFGG